jgi:hypothetical protein
MKFLLLSLFFSMRLEIRGSDVFIELGRAGETKLEKLNMLIRSSISTLMQLEINQFQH